MTPYIEQAIKDAAEKGGKRDYMREPQEWMLGHYADREYSYVHISSKGAIYTAWADNEDIGLVSLFRWYMKDGYAVTSSQGRRVKMHHMIKGKPEKGMETDHINRNRLDNRKENLRFVSSLENGQNTTAEGVREHGKRWEANVCLNYKKIFKSFSTKQEALNWRHNIKSLFITHLAAGLDAESFFKSL